MRQPEAGLQRNSRVGWLCDANSPGALKYYYWRHALIRKMPPEAYSDAHVQGQRLSGSLWMEQAGEAGD